MIRRTLAYAFSLALCVAACAEISPASLSAAAVYSASHRGLSFLVIQNGKTLIEEYSKGSSEGTPRKIYSGVKAYWNLAALAAAEDGLLNLDDRVCSTITEWQGDPRKSRVMVRQLLDFSSGLDSGFFLHGNNPGDRGRLAIALPIVAEPGAEFIYGPASLQVFHEVLKRKLAPKRETPTRYLERRVLRPLGLGSQRHLKDSAGNPLLAAGWLLTARQWSGIGRLALAGGSPVVSSNSMAQCWRGSGANRSYSLGWWNNRATGAGGREFDVEDMLEKKWQQQSWRGACICRDAPSDLVACIGSGYQRLYVIPSLDLVVVRHGGFGRFSDGDFLRLLLGR